MTVTDGAHHLQGKLRLLSTRRSTLKKFWRPTISTWRGGESPRFLQSDRSLTGTFSSFRTKGKVVVLID